MEENIFMAEFLEYLEEKKKQVPKADLINRWPDSETKPDNAFQFGSKSLPEFDWLEQRGTLC